MQNNHKYELRKLTKLCKKIKNEMPKSIYVYPFFAYLLAI